MESIERLNLAQAAITQAADREREKLLTQWLRAECGLQTLTLQAMPGDASMRRYFRATTPAGTFVAMDAPPPQENCCPYIAIAKALRGLNLNAPEIVHANAERGFLLLTDFGDATYLKTLNVNNANRLYQHALDALAVLQTCRHVPAHTIPFFTADFMWKEWAWHKEWFLQKLLGLDFTAEEAQLDACYAALVEAAVTQPQVFMHRDYHAANLMVLSEDVGILDFQDAFIGPLTYDLVSLLRDCYIAWPAQQVQEWALYYWQLLHKQGQLNNVTQQQFLRWFDWMGVQRHLKALLTFARKQVRDGQSRYLEFIPRTLNYLLTTTALYPELTALYEFLNNSVQPTYARLNLCAQ